jgi:DNA-binding NarL/FixJ family response regulator
MQRDDRAEGLGGCGRGARVRRNWLGGVCLGGAGCGGVLLFVLLDALLEAHTETPQQMAIRAMAVFGLGAAGALLSLIIQSRLSRRLRAAQERVERQVQAAQEEARFQGALLTLRELSPLLARDVRFGAAGSLPVELPAPSTDQLRAPLTPREREVAVLIGRGYTSRDIAQALVITERTADTHADRIRGKLGLRSRMEIVAWVVSQAPPVAVDQGLTNVASHGPA